MAEAYVPPEVWAWEPDPDNYFAAINRPDAGARHEAELPVGRHPFQLHSTASPNGQKVTILFEELLEAGHAGAEYDAWPIRIMKGEQFSSGFVALNPNSKIPALLDRSGPEPVRVFESGAILIHLAEKFGAFLPAGGAARAECLSWLMWQMSSTPFMSSGFGHFYAFAPEKLKYPIDRFALETKRLFDVADRRLAESRYFAGAEITIADFALFPWLSKIQSGAFYNNAARFLGLDAYRNVARWVAEIAPRPGVRRGLLVNTNFPEDEGSLRERHDRSDFARFGL